MVCNLWNDDSSFFAVFSSFLVQSEECDLGWGCGVAGGADRRKLYLLSTCNCFRSFSKRLVPAEACIPIFLVCILSGFLEDLLTLDPLVSQRCASLFPGSFGGWIGREPASVLSAVMGWGWLGFRRVK